MPVPASINDLSTTAGANSPAGSEGPQEGDNYIRSLSSFIAVLRDKLNGTSATGEINDATFAGTMAGAATWSSLQTFSGGISATDGTFSGDIVVGDDASIGGDLTVTGSLLGAGIGTTYTPTVSNKSNVSTVTTNAAMYVRLGSSVLVAGQILVLVDAAGAASFQLSLPVASNFSAGTQLAGHASSGESPNAAATFQANTTNDTAQLNWTEEAGSLNRLFGYLFMYRII